MEEDMTKTLITLFFYLSVNSVNLITNFRINDVFILSDPNAKGIVSDEPINLWIKPKTNRFTVELDLPKSEELNPALGKVNAVLFISDPESEIPKPGKILTKFIWPIPDQESVFPYVFNGTFDVENPPDTYLWKDAEQIETLIDKDKEEMINKVNGLIDAFLKKDINRILSNLEYRFEEEARAEGKSAERIREVVTEQYNWMFGLGELTAEKLDNSNAVLKIVGDSKVVQINKNQYDPAIIIQNEPSDLNFGINVFFAKIKGNWIIVR